MPKDYVAVVFLDAKQLTNGRKIDNYYQIGQQLILKIDTISHFNKKASLSDSRRVIYYNDAKHLLETQSGFKNLQKLCQEQINSESKFENKVTRLSQFNEKILKKSRVLGTFLTLLAKVYFWPYYLIYRFIKILK
ncbi:hypothetical protein R7W53_01625 [Mesomycoplasma ovipneumoniae]|uniref:hypothetical protein n=1 Tax=Mesomycoplasma ovipneumoniae TaxID=29562 RepID=UPI0029644971|nr:hypothetical protein [Mesomycoplasma ovipneumoniae]MDW2906996.1 hypothetical protein [Mesomycoplasma ovipneumoniae]